MAENYNTGTCAITRASILAAISPLPHLFAIVGQATAFQVVTRAPLQCEMQIAE
jgi:hypothetical protein